MMDGLKAMQDAAIAALPKSDPLCREIVKHVTAGNALARRWAALQKSAARQAREAEALSRDAIMYAERTTRLQTALALRTVATGTTN